jgi:Nucleotide modification associated domain 2
VKVYSYVIEHDLEFAPNPFHGTCTLACCKPDIRKKAVEGDYILGTGAVKPKLRGHLTFWMHRQGADLP